MKKSFKNKNSFISYKTKSGISVRIFEANNNIYLFAIPGGPAFSSRYLDSLSLYRREYGLVIFDLPNHDSSIINNNDIDFIQASALMHSAIEEIALIYPNYNLFGHSLGGMLILDFLVESKKLSFNPKNIYLCSTLINLERSSRFKSEKKQLLTTFKHELEFNTNQDYRVYLKQILKLYFSRTTLNSIEKIDGLSLYYIEGSKLLNSIPYDFQGKYIKLRKQYHNILFIQGDSDIIVSDNNAKKIQSIGIKTKLIRSCGHFPMLEKITQLSNFIFR